MMIEISVSLDTNQMTLRTSRGQISMTAMEDQYCIIRMMNNIKVEIQYVHGPTTIKLAHCFYLAVQLITFILFQDVIRFLCREIHNGCAIQQCKYCKFFKRAGMLFNINVFFCFAATTASTCSNTSVRHCNVINPNTTSVSNTSARPCNVNTLSKRQSSGLSTHQCKASTLL